jgi:tRNA pseudouridine38-40 synthase
VRIALGVEYAGTDFCGWQYQPHARNVQGALQQAVSKVANHPVDVYAAGRTDTGVHALNQVVHFDTDSVREQRGWLLGINANLPKDVNVTWV